MLKKTGKILIGTVGAILVLAMLALFVSSLLYTPEYVRRVLAWRESDVNDYRYNFPSRSLAAAPEAFYFDEAPDEDRIAKQFETILEIDDFDVFLEEMETQSFIVIQDDVILYEKYFNDTERDTMLTSFSTAKSFTSALIGIAIDEGYINSADDPITDYLPELAERDPNFKNITIRHLLMMAGGLDYQEFRPTVFNSDDILTTYYPNQRKAALEFTQIADAPGQYFLYNKYYPQLLGLILERTTGRSVTDYLQEKIWNPLGMEFGGSWSLDSQASGFEKMEAGLNSRAIDFAKLGRLYLENGNWNGEQVISSEWIADSTQVDSSTHHEEYYPDEFGQTIFGRLEGYYKYMWYGFFRAEGAYDFAAEGDHGQFIYVSPQKNLIIVRNGIEYGDDWGTASWTETLYEFASEF
jgi:CubicO group peptidase (beta-lactamase class C family)